MAEPVIAAPRRGLCLALRAASAALLAAAATLALAFPARAAAPTADFTVTPSTPSVGLAATYDAVLSSAYRRATVEWDFDADPGGVFETQASSVLHVYATAGEKQVSMRVVKGGEVKAVVTKTVSVAAAPIATPMPAPVPPSQLPTPPDDPGAVDEGVSMITPFPIVRIAGQLLPWGVRIRLLAVSAPPGTVVTARCRGRRCPLRQVSRRSRGRPLHIRGLERRLVAGIRLQILVRQPGLIGKYTLFRVRRGSRPPLRDDRCLRPGRRAPIPCSFG